MSLFWKNFTILLVSVIIMNCGYTGVALADVCISDQDAVDIITLLDASERDITVLGSCEKLVKDLYAQLDERDVKLVKVTEDLIEAKHEVIKYKESSKRWRRVAIYSSVTSAILILVQLAPLL